MGEEDDVYTQIEERYASSFFRRFRDAHYMATTALGAAYPAKLNRNTVEITKYFGGMRGTLKFRTWGENELILTLDMEMHKGEGTIEDFVEPIWMLDGGSGNGVLSDRFVNKVISELIRKGFRDFYRKHNPKQ